MLNNQTDLANFIKTNLELSGKTYDAIGAKCGYKDGKLILAFSQGQVRLPLDKVAPLAAAIDCDLDQLFRLALQAWFTTDIVDQMKRSLPVNAPMDPGEAAWLLVIRELVGGTLPEMNDRLKRRLRLVLAAL